MEYTYYAFISYKREDEKWAKWLQKKLEAYGFPTALRKENPTLPSKIRPVFRDQSELSGGNLKDEIEKGLKGSKYLIVVCSPRAAKSPWVSKEVQYFIDHGRENNIIPFIIGGSPNAANPEDECFPEGLRQLSGEKEILGININEMGREAAAIKVIARMFGLRFDTLWQRHERAKSRRRIAIIAGTLTFAILSFGIGAYMVYLNTRIAAERDRAENQTEIARKERNRANDERDNALKANKALAQAKDSIQLQSSMLAKANNDLKESNRRLAEERDNVLKANWEIKKKTIYSQSLVCEKDYDAGKYQASYELAKNIFLTEPSIPDTLCSKLEYLLRMSYHEMQSDTLKLVNRYKAMFPAMDWGDMPIVFDENGSTAYVGCNGFAVIDTSNGNCINRSGFWPQKFVVSDDKIYSFDDYMIAVYDANNLNKIKSYTLSHSSENYHMIVSPSADGKRFLTCDNNNHYNVFDTQTGKLLKTFTEKCKTASINHDGSVVALSVNDKLKLYDIDKNREIPGVSNLYAADLKYDESGKWLLLYLENYQAVNVYNPDTKESYQIDLKNNNYWGNSFNFTGNYYGNKYIMSDDNRYLAIGPRLYDLPTGKLISVLKDENQAMGLKIFPGASKVIQINENQEILVYTRSGKPMFDIAHTDFQNMLLSDNTKSLYKVELNGFGNISIKDKSGKPMGIIKDIDGDIYHVSISPDKKYALISSQAIPTSLYDISTGTLIQKFPFTTGDGDIGFGVFGSDGFIYFNSLQAVLRYKLLSLEEMLKL